MSRTPLEPGPHEVLVDGFTHGGEGVTRIEGKAVFVPGALPGERVRVRVVDDRKRWARAELIDVLDASELRVAPPCPYVPDCGGCDLQHASGAGQRELKARVVREQLERLGGLDEPPVAACRAAVPLVGYRSQARMHADTDGRLGFHRASSNDVVPIAHCLVLTDDAQRLREQVGDDSGAQEVTLRTFDATGVVSLTPHRDRPLALEGIDGADVLLVQPDGRTTALRGDGDLPIEIDGQQLTVPAEAFFQSGPAAARALVTEVVEAAGTVDGVEVWDLYAGVGLLSLPLAARGARVTAVEGNRAAASAARHNAEVNGVELTVHATSVEAALGAPYRASPEAPALVVLDPPRQGAGQRVIDAITQRAPSRLVYVACDPAALARDARLLVDRGYRLEIATPLDLFPMTSHVEVVAVFTR